MASDCKTCVACGEVFSPLDVRHDCQGCYQAPFHEDCLLRHIERECDGEWKTDE
jgi:hypothetical protein